ncbi:hypothetical protein Glove_54g111 [Diversispora epigaea]|uniref:Transposable element P transposase-like RNase H domain-containing protein n=1 Tax=Diversispora epigaea TaxID=1348612 RepID=A0A397JLU1_9GLOM|nr:hypothetical protein Glove_54g111 [Diversispora epigaea]
MYDKKEKRLTYIVLKVIPNFTRPSIASILAIKEKILPGEEFSGTAIQEISGGLEFRFATIDKQSEKKLLIFSKNGLYSYEVCVFNKVVQDVYLSFPINAIERTLGDIINIIHYVFFVQICHGQSTIGFEDIIHIRGTQLVNKEIDHTPFALMEKNGQVYRQVDCTLVIKENITCENCSKLKKTLQQIQRRISFGVNSTKIIHASKEILTEKIILQQKIIKEQNEKIKNYIKKKIENEEEEVSNEIANVVYTVIKDVTNTKIDLSTLHPIFQELIHIQSEKLNGTRYHPIKSGHDAIKEIIRLPAISTIKRFFSHDSFKIQKGLLWDQRKNCYIGYLDFENELHEYQQFALQCKHEIEGNNSSNSLSTCTTNKQKFNLATQVHQFIWHSITHNFAFPISYYRINNITPHILNTLIFNLAAKLECVGIHTCASICDEADENKVHIKSFDWYASKWISGDIVEVNFNKDKRSFHIVKILSSNLERTKFTVIQLDCNNSKNITIDRSFIRAQMLLKLKWNIDELCEFKRKIINLDPSTQTLIVEIFVEEWKVLIEHADKFLKPVYDIQKLSTSHKTINPITGEDWYFISDPTHVFKKLRNNLSKSYTGEKNSREIIFNKKEISWKYIKAKATKLTKRHIWLTSWSKMRVDLAEDTLSKEVKDALASIKELKEISEGTRYRQIMHSKIWFRSLTDTRC